ncbi:YciI family protein [Agromyces albus]|uniref:YCII-related domain-containing protein n=1 Tax=Agromyces albus TaxID=205332 RepID=A0A4Q2KV55_9MICO|nr:YciI family protein [Agromyces albus]RXZ67673.1 hypothetical protein ESP51_16865 [Agromyces albus]
MEFLMLVMSNPADGEPFVPEDDNIGDWVDEVESRGVHIRGERLRPPADATTVRRRAGEVLVTDGPFAESKEWIAGYDIIECESLDEAIEIASKHPMARFGHIELRPAWPFDAHESPRERYERELLEETTAAG